MGRLFAILFGVILGGAAVYAAHEYHIVRVRGETLIVRKKVSTWRDIYVDIREWSFKEWNSHRELAQNMAAAGHAKHIVRAPNETPFPGFMGSYRDRPASPHMPPPGHNP